MAERILLRRDTAANWALGNPVLALGEPGFDETADRWKMGDGVTAWTALPYATDAVVWLPNSNGTDDTAALNAVLATAVGRYVRGVPGQTYRLSAPLLLPPLPAGSGGLVLDMGGCRIKGVGTGAFNLLNNAGVTPQRTVADAATTSGSTTLTSATAAFTAADVGSYVRVAGANVAGDLLVARILSVTNTTTVVLDTVAATAVTAATCGVHAVDYDLTLTGGTWDHLPDNRQWVFDVRDHSIVLRAVERFVVRDMVHTSLGGKYSIHVGGAKNGRITGHFYDNYASDGVHITGPAVAIDVRDISGTTGDDMFVLTAQESSVYAPNNYNDWIGDIRQVTGENIHKDGNLARVVALQPGRSGSLYDVKIRNVSGHAISYGLFVQGDVNNPGGIIDDLVVENVHTFSDDPAGNGMGMVGFDSVACGQVTLRNLWREQPGSSNNLIDTVGTTIDALLVQGARMENSGTGHILKVAQNTAGVDCHFGTVTLADVRWKPDGSAYGIETYGAASFDSLTLQNWDVDATGDTTLLSINPAGSIGVCRLDGIRFHNSGTAAGSLVRTAAGGVVLPEVFLSEVYADGAYWIADLNCTTNLRFSNLKTTGNGIYVYSAGDVRVWGAGLDVFITSPGSYGVQAGGLLRSLTNQFRVDLSMVNSKQTGDQAFNTNGALSCGVGPVAYTGTAWKNLATGATY